MENKNFSKILIIMGLGHSITYPMMQVPSIVTHSIAAHAGKLAQYLPNCTTASENQNFLDTTNKEVIKSLQQNIAQNLKKFQSSTRFKTQTTHGMFNATQPMLMTWNYKENPHTILGTSDNATEKELKAAHKKMAMKHHPDLGGKPEDFRKVQEAYEYASYLLKIGQKYKEKTSQEQYTQNSYYQDNHSEQTKKNSYQGYNEYQNAYNEYQRSYNEYQKAYNDYQNTHYSEQSKENAKQEFKYHSKDGRFSGTSQQTIDMIEKMIKAFKKNQNR